MKKNSLLRNYWKFSVHDRNFRTLATAMYRIYHGISSTIMDEIFTLTHQNQYHLTNWTYLNVLKVRTVNHGSGNVKYLGSKIWEIIPIHTKELYTIDKFIIANGNQNLVHVGYAMSIYKIYVTYRLEHEFAASFRLVRWRFFGTAVNGF